MRTKLYIKHSQACCYKLPNIKKTRSSSCFSVDVNVPSHAHFEITQMTMLAPVPLFQLPTAAKDAK